VTQHDTHLPAPGDQVGQQLQSCLADPARLRFEERLDRHTTFRIGGPAQYFAIVHTEQELACLLKTIHAAGLPLYVLGNGSNLLVSDSGVRGLVIQLAGEFNTYQVAADGLVTVGGGYNLPRLATQLSKQGWAGIDFACAIPGTVGAGLVINAGAHGGELVNVVTSATVVWPDGRLEEIPADRLGLRYRGSDLQGTGAIVTRVTMRLAPGNPAELQEKMQHHLEHRRRTQPLNLPNAGSVFKNPPGDFAGRLIQSAGLKGTTRGQAQVSEKHANFVVNLGGATAADVLQLMAHVRDVVEQRFGVRLVNEVQIWGENPYF
jgi:UDP-N-acetylmuramate dehydrogenase